MVVFFPVMPWKLREAFPVRAGDCSCTIVHAQYENHERLPGRVVGVSCFS
jgi:hypothetical protein